jgi:hypothetical protein
MLFPKYALEDLTIGSGSIIGKGNIEGFFNHVSMHKDVEDKSLAKLAPSYEVVVAYLVHMLETLRREFRDVVIEARKVFERFNMLGSCVEVVGTNKEEIKVPIPCKLVGLHEALENNFDWICPENLFDKRSEPKSVHKGSSKTHLDTIQ